ncbi:MAG: hypothetical protein EOO41_05315 [Methanobacteriota archaeon]|nr:MAG: hypothetical protein EOO41_05315 [Euryarchaeota archaeon]
MAELALAVAQIPDSLPTPLLDAIRNVVVVAEKKRVYTGRGGEIVRAAMCRLIECQCLAHHTISRKAALRLLQTVDECMKHPNDIIQAAAVAALRALAAHALSDPEPAVLDRLPKTYIQKLQSEENPAVRRGLALALGALPRTLLCGGGDELLSAILDALSTASKQEKQVAKRDAETRRNAVMGLTEVCLTVGVGARVPLVVQQTEAGTLLATAAAPDATWASRLRAEALPGMNAQQFQVAWDAIMCATHDYATDNRGDVGSWVRKAACEGVERVLRYLHVQATYQQALVSGAHSAACTALVSSMAGVRSARWYPASVWCLFGRFTDLE